MQSPLEFDPVRASHLDVKQRNVPFVLGHASERIACALSRTDFVSFFAEPFSQRIADAQFIVDDQQFALSFHVGHLPLTAAAISLFTFVRTSFALSSDGRLTVNVVPRPTSDCTSIFP